MKPNLNKAVAAIISRLEKTEQFVLEQAPDICKEIIVKEQISIKYGLILSSAGLVSAVCVWQSLVAA